MDREQEIKYFAQRILALREAHGLTPKEMAKRPGIGKKTLLSIENGILPPRLSCAILFRVEREFGVPPKDMFLPTVSESIATKAK